jgi:chaperone modulatory protein CbpM
MIGIELLTAQVPGLDRRDLERWILLDWVKPETEDGRYVFQAIDVARVRLIRELRDGMSLSEEALPVVLILLDQLYETRRRMRELGSAVALLAPEELRLRLLTHLTEPNA